MMPLAIASVTGSSGHAGAVRDTRAQRQVTYHV
jgi:hypothetical protein